MSGTSKKFRAVFFGGECMSIQTLQVIKQITVQQLLEQERLDPNLYIVSQEGKQVRSNQILKHGQEVKVIAIVMGG